MTPNFLNCVWLKPDGEYEGDEKISHIDYVKKHSSDLKPDKNLFPKDPDLSLLLVFMKTTGWVRVSIDITTKDLYFHFEKELTDAQNKTIDDMEKSGYNTITSEEEKAYELPI